MEKDKIRKHLNNAMEQQVPDVWDEISSKIQRAEQQESKIVLMPSKTVKQNKRSTFYKRVSMVAACLIAIFTLTFTPVLASIQEFIDKIFTSEHIDDAGLKTALGVGIGQAIDQTFYDEKHDITVHFESVLTDDAETKLLLTYQSDKTELENYYLDVFEGSTTINLFVGTEKKPVDNVGWGSRYYDSKENKVYKAFSLESLKEYEGQEIRLEINNFTIYEGQKTKTVETTLPVEFTLDKSAVTDRESVELNKEFTFDGQTYIIKRVEFSDLETRLVITGTDIKIMTDPDGTKYRKRNKMEEQFLNARKHSKEFGYTVDYNKAGVFLKSAGEYADPIYNKGEVEGEPDEYYMSFAPVKDRQDCILEIGEELKIPLTK